MSQAGINLANGFLSSLEDVADKTALVVDTDSYSYSDLATCAGRIRNGIDELEAGNNPLVGLLAHRSATAFASILAVLSRGSGYVPLNPTFPAERTLRMLVSAQPGSVIVGRECVDYLCDIAPRLDRPTRFLLPDTIELPEALLTPSEHVYLCAKDLPRVSGDFSVRNVSADTIAYLLFTSGSTGEPKGVMVTHGNVNSYIDYMLGSFEFHRDDRFSQNFELTFDLSVHDILLPVYCGASIHCPSFAATKIPGKYIKDHEITIWFSVPSVTTLMSLLGLAKEDAYPSIRLSFFCGEALPLHTAQLWNRAAPNSQIVNLYGPTEATIAITRFDFDPATTEDECHNGVVSIGKAFNGQAVAVVDESSETVPTGETGELCLSGSQLALGYWKNPSKTKDQFVALPGHGTRLWYRTGDLVFEDSNGDLHYVGRNDDQVKVMGHRVELHEVELYLRKFSRCDSVAAVPWPVEHGMAEGIEAFVVAPEGVELSEKFIIKKCGENLPEYMIPNNIQFIDEMPLNANGKLDRKRLVEKYLANNS